MDRLDLLDPWFLAIQWVLFDRWRRFGPANPKARKRRLRQLNRLGLFGPLCRFGPVVPVPFVRVRLNLFVRFDPWFLVCRQANCQLNQWVRCNHLGQ